MVLIHFAGIGKKKGQSSHIKDYRDVSLADCCGRVPKRHVRHEIRPHLETYILQTMCGGFLRRGYDFCSHFNRTIVSLAKVIKFSAATLYVDIACAFARVMRCLVSGSSMSDQNVVRVFSQLGFAPAIFDQFKIMLQDDPALVKASVPANLQNALSCFLSNLLY